MASVPQAFGLARNSSDLENRIGSHWLNRIGITAVLIGVSYFLKYAFENNWIGAAGRIAIGLIAGISVVLWSACGALRGTAADFSMLFFASVINYMDRLTLSSCSVPISDELQLNDEQYGRIELLFGISFASTRATPFSVPPVP